MSNEAWVDFVAGWLSGGASVLACQPIDTVLTRMQANTADIRTAGLNNSISNTLKTTVSLNSVSDSAAVPLRASNIYRGMVHDFGVTSLWRGSSAMIGAVPIQNALLMSGYGAGKRWSESHDSSNKRNALLAVFVGGCTGGVLQSFIMSPVELVKVTQQVVGKSMVSATSSVARGLFSSTGAWRGLGATLLRDGIPHGVWFASYEYAKEQLCSQRNDLENSNSSPQGEITTPLLAGAFAATTAWGVGYPFDLIKTRIQAGNGKGIMGTAQQLVNESGGRFVHGLYKGFTLKLFRAIPASAIGFLVYETASKALS